MSEDNKRTWLYHPDPWGNGVSIKFVWFPAFDGELTDIRKEFWISRGWTITYEDV